jgi:hypothetical protein
MEVVFEVRVGSAKCIRHLDCHICKFFGLHTNGKFKAIFKINIVNFLIIHVVINFNGNHYKKLG